VANIKSAKKRIKVIEKKTAENRVQKSSLKTQLKKFDAAVNSKNAEGLDTLYNETVSKVDMVAAKGVIHKNKAAHTKAQLAKKMSSLVK